jgi:hypothetical protein
MLDVHEEITLPPRYCTQGQAPQACVMQGVAQVHDSARCCATVDGGCGRYKVRSSLQVDTALSAQLHSLPASSHSLIKATLISVPIYQTFPPIIRTAMCLRSSIDRFAIPCIYEVEGITTMPVCHLLSPEINRCYRTNSNRYLVVVAPPVWSAETLFGSSPANAAHSAARLSTRLAALVQYVLLRMCIGLLLTC